MDKVTFKAIVEAIVSGFEDPEFKRRFEQARASENISEIMALPAEIQARAFGAQGLDPATGVSAFKEAGARFGADDDIAPLLGRMKAAL